jgi:hypothetical protein
LNYQPVNGGFFFMQDLSKLISKWPSAYVARSEVARFSGGLFQPGTLANLDSKGEGPEGRIRIGRKVAYEIHSLVRWMEKRNRVDSQAVMAQVRSKRRGQDSLDHRRETARR